MKKTLLIVDDETSIVESLQEILEYEGYGVRVASNGREALAAVDTEVPALVLTDLMMAVINGLQLMEALRERPGLQALPIILMSAVHVQPPRSRQLWTAFLGKPFEIDVLLSTIAAALPRTPPRRTRGGRGTMGA
jgi:two-component system, OmpR family, response regulator VicR